MSDGLCSFWYSKWEEVKKNNGCDLVRTTKIIVVTYIGDNSGMQLISMGVTE